MALKKILFHKLYIHNQVKHLTSLEINAQKDKEETVKTWSNNYIWWQHKTSDNDNLDGKVIKDLKKNSIIADGLLVRN